MGRKTGAPKLSELEKDYLGKTLGRIPTGYECDTIGWIWQDYYKKYPYRDMINRAQTIHDEVPLTDDSSSESVFRTVVEIGSYDSDKNLVLAYYELIAKLLVRRCAPKIGVISGNVINTSGAVSEKILRKLNVISKIHRFPTYAGQADTGSDNDLDTSGNLMVAGICQKDAPVDTHAHKGVLMSISPSLAGGKKQRLTVVWKNIHKMLNVLADKPWLINLSMASERNCINDIIDYLSENRLGIDISLAAGKIGSDTDPLKLADRFLLVQIQEGFESDLENFLSDFDLSTVKIGVLKDEIDYFVTSGEETLAHVPANIFMPDVSLLPDYSAIFPVEEDDSNDEVIAEENLSSYNSRLTELLKSSVKDGLLDTSASYCQSAALNEIPASLVVELNQNNYLQSLNPNLAGMVLVAEASRRLACAGAIPREVNAHLPASFSSQPELMGQFNKTVTGLADACHKMGLKLKQVKFNDPDAGGSKSAAIGITGLAKLSNNPISTTFRNEGDFITILGSLRGELGGSLYRRKFYGTDAGTMPTIDFGMEGRLQEAVVQGIEGKFINSAYSVGLGGLAFAAAHSLVGSEKGLGARIHLSRKLLSEELLFGESQGVIMITLSESDLMEFERICMNVGVPSTTIGRVTADNKFTFNDLIDIKADSIRSLI